MRNLVESIRNFYQYPNKITNLDSFFRYEELQKRFEFCPHDKSPSHPDCPVDKELMHGDYPPEVCDKCMIQYLEDSDLPEDQKAFLYNRFSPKGGRKDNSWIVIHGPSNKESEKDITKETPEKEEPNKKPFYKFW